MKQRIALFDSKSYDKEAFELANATYHYDISYFDPNISMETAVLAEGFPVVCLFVHDAVNGQLAQKLSQLGVKLLALRSNGYNHIDLQAAKGLLKVTHVPKYSPYSVAEYTIGLMLCINRKLHQVYWRTRTNNFSLVGLQGFDMHGKTVGVIGAGLIGKIVVRLLSAFGTRILVHDKSEDADFAKQTGCVYTDLDTIYKESDIITLHCPLFQDTKYLINKSSIDKMKPGVYLINTSRGGLVDTEDLIEGLKSKKIGAAALDVYEEEERYFYEDLSSSFIDDDTLARLLTFPNVCVSAHQAFFTKEAMTEIANTTMANIRSFFEGQKLLNEITV